jgi:MFS transporter, DHA2 family, multidrug resistance protein
MSPTVAHAADQKGPPSAPTSTMTTGRALVGVAAVLAGAFISTINTRLTTVGLADIRGGLSLGVDEGSWFSTVFSASLMIACLSAAWFSVVFGPRRLLLWSSAIFCITSALVPLTRDPNELLVLQFVRGLSVGTFIPATIGFILHELPPRWWSWGLAAYALRFVFSQNISSSIEAFYDAHGLWPWMFWQNLVLTPIMMVLIWFGMSRQPVNLALLRGGDWWGIVFGGSSLALLYAALDQGNRLDWLNSGVMIGLLASGGLLLVTFVVNELIVERPLIDFRLVPANVWIAAVMICIYTFGSSATGFVLPDYLTRVQGLRSLQIGDVLDWIALPQIVLVPLVAWLLRYCDARLTLASGLALIAIGSWMNSGLTHDWANDDFMPSQLVEAVGIAIGITSLIIFGIANTKPAAAITIAGMIQVARLLGAEIGQAFIQTFVRVQEQVHSNLIGLNVSAGEAVTVDRTALLSQLLSDQSAGLANSTGAAMLTIGNLVRREAYVLAYIDAFWLVAWVMTISLGLLLFLKPPPPNPLTPPRVKPPR